MKGQSASITSKGQVTIPASVRDYLDVQAGDRLLFVRDAERVYVEKMPGRVSSDEVFGALHRPGQEVLDVEEARAKARAKRAKRSETSRSGEVLSREDQA